MADSIALRPNIKLVALGTLETIEDITAISTFHDDSNVNTRGDSGILSIRITHHGKASKGRTRGTRSTFALGLLQLVKRSE
jgi:hypothetical protein